MRPRLELLCPLLRGFVGSCVGPFPERGLDEAFGLAVGFRRVGPGADVLELQALTGAREGEGFVAGAVVGHDACDRDAEASVISDGGLEEGRGADGFLVWH